MDIIKRLNELAVELGGSVDNPFSTYDDITVFRHGQKGKWFGLVMPIPAYYFGGADAEHGLTVKCPPDIGFLLKEKYSSVKPAYHMNKEQWITVRLDGSVPYDEVEKILALSYDVTAVKAKRNRSEPRG